MDDDFISRYAYLWTTEADERILVPATDRKWITEPFWEYLIVHTPTGSCLIIEDEEVHRMVIKHMLEAGVKVVGKDYFTSQKWERRKP